MNCCEEMGKCLLRVVGGWRRDGHGCLASCSLAQLKFSPSGSKCAAASVSISSHTGIVVYTNALAWKLI